MATVYLHIGTDRSDRRAVILDQLAQHGTRARLLAPTTRFARALTQTALDNADSAGWFGARIQHFQDFTRELLRGSPLDLPLITPTEQRLLLREAVNVARAEGKLGEFTEAADTDGLLKHIHQIIVQLKQGAVESEDFEDRVLRTKTTEPRDEAVATVYNHYQILLKEHGWVDQQGMYWLAAEACKATPPPPLLDSLDVLLLEGFDDFTSSEFRLIQAIEPHIDAIHFGLNRDTQSANQQDLYTAVKETQDIIAAAEGFEPIAESLDERAPSGQLETIEANIFWRDTPPKPASGGNVTLQPCRDPQHELEWCAREIKHRCINGECAPEDFAVIARDWSGFGRRVRDVFAEMGVPIQFNESISLPETGPGSFAIALLGLAPDWTRDAVVDVLASACYRPNGTPSEHAPCYAETARAAYVHEGIENWLSGLERLEKRVKKEGAPDHPPLANVPNPLELIVELRKEVERIYEHFDPTCAKDDALAAHAAQIFDAYKILGLFADSELTPIDRQAIDAIRAALGALMRWPDQTPLTRAEAIQRIHTTLTKETITPESPKNGVAVFSMEQARHQRWPHIYLLRANEGVLPAASAQNAIYGSSDAKRLREFDIALNDPMTHLRREMLLFHRAIQTPTNSLTITWSENASDGAALLPSPFVRDVDELVTGKRDRDLGSPADAFEIAPDRLASRRDAANRDLLNPKQTPQPLRNELAHARESAEIEQKRYRPIPFDQYDAILNDPENLDAIFETFGPMHVYSASSLETFVDCPFRFFQQYVLDIPNPESLDRSFNPMIRGQIAHATLEEFFKSLEGQPVSGLPEDEARTKLDAAFQHEFERLAWRGEAHPGFERAERIHLAEMLQAYLTRAREEEAGPQWTPTHFEAGFGPMRHDSDKENLNEEPYLLHIDDTEVRLSGRIDRIDLNADGTEARIIDYKTGGAVTSTDITTGRVLQLSLYAMALEDHFMPGVKCDAAIFANLASQEEKEALGKKIKREDWKPWPVRQKIALDAVRDAVTEIRAGRFHPTKEDKPCKYCPHQRACRYQHARIAAKADA